MAKPYISIVMASRNDNHGGDLNERTQACIDSLSNQIKKFNLSAEVVMVDWNPPADKPLLHEIINHKDIAFKSIVVPQEIHNRYGQAHLFPLYQMIAKNAGILRSNGEFILATNVDIFFSDDIIRELAKQELERGTIYRAFRYDVKRGTRSLENVKENLIRLNLSYKEELCTNACGDFQLLHRDDWFRLRGYYEVDLFSIHIDSLFEYHAYYNGCIEQIFNPPRVIYHVEHDGGWVPDVGKTKEYNRMNDEKIKKLSYEDLLRIISIMTKKNKSFSYNPKNWGLSDDILKEFE